MNVFIIHGTFGDPEENWFPWLKSKLEEEGHRVFVPEFPTPENQSLENWLEVFEEYEKYLNEDSIVIGHSLGPAFLLNVLEELDHPIKAAFFVSPCVNLLGDPKFDRLNRTFVEKDFNWKKIRNNCKKFFLFHSDNDPYVPLKQTKELNKRLNGELTVVEGAGHFNKDAGYTEFDLLLRKIKGEI